MTRRVPLGSLLLSVALAALSCAAGKGGDVDRLLADLNDAHWQIRASAAEELGRRQVERAVPALRAALVDNGMEVRAAALIALARLHARSALDDIRIRIRDDDDPQVVVQALFALGAIARKEDPERYDNVDLIVSRLSEETGRINSAARRVLFKLEGRRGTVAMIREQLRSPSTAARMRGSRMALSLNLPELSGWPRERLDDPDPAVRRNAYEAIARSPNADLALLLDGLRDASPAVRVAAAWGLGELADPASIPALERAVGADADSSVRQEAASALAAIFDVPGETIPALWHFASIDDRIAIDRRGACTLTRTFTLVVDRSPEAVRNVNILVPWKFPHVDRVVDARGSPLAFTEEWRGRVRQLEIPVAPIENGVPATFTVSARSARPLSAQGADEVLVTYQPGPVQANVRALHVSIVPPGGGTESTFDRVDASPGDVEALVYQVPVPASALAPGSALPRTYSKREDLATALGVLAVILGCGAAISLRLRRTLGEKADRAILVVALTTGGVLLLTPMLQEDNLTYYALARTAVLDGDLDRDNEYADFNQTQAYVPDDRGSLDPTLGALARTPCVAAAHALTAGMNAISPEQAPNGFSFPYLFLTAVGDFLMVLIGCLACFALVERRVGGRYALYAVLSVVLGTNLLLFTYAWTSSSFQPSFLLFAVFLNHWDKTRDARGAVDWFGAGLLLGLLGITRTLNLGFALIPLLDWLYEAAVRLREAGARGLARHTGRGALLAAGMLVAFAPQILLQRMVDQTWLVDTYGIGTGRFTGLLDHLWGLFVAESGLFSTMPVLALVLAGFVPLFRIDRRLATLATAALALQLFAIASYEIYWGYFWYGSPYLVPSSPILCLATAGLFRAVHVRWRRLGPIVLSGLVVLFAARNAWCVLRQLATKMIGSWQSSLGVVPVLRKLLFLDRKLDVDVLRVSSEFGCLVREIVGGVRARDAFSLSAALFWVLLLVAAVVAVYRGGNRIRRRLSRMPRRSRLPVALSVLAVTWLALMGWLATLASNTDLDYESFVEREWTVKRELTLHRLEAGKTFDWHYVSTNPADRFTLITFLDEAVDVPRGERVATVEIVSDQTRSRFDLRAGEDTADFEVDRPESRPARGHAAPLDRACFQWRVRDDSSGFYTARAYCNVFETPVAAIDTTLTLTSTLSHGAIDVVLASAKERKIPRDPTRRRWLAERW